MKSVSIFQTVVLALFVFIAIAGVAVFAGFGGVNSKAVPKATIWGTLPESMVNEVVRQLNLKSNVVDVTYVAKDPDTFQSDFVNALADGTGPDAVIISDKLLYSEENKLQPIPYTVFNQRDFLNTYIDGASVLATSNGILGVPISVDPMVMYWNKNILAKAGIAAPPKTWGDLQAMGPALIQKTDASDLTQEMVAMGEYSNVTNAKDILATLFFQINNPITAYNSQSGQMYSTIDVAGGDRARETASATDLIDFYTSFADPTNANYTWSTALPSSQDQFLADDLAFYFGHASELTTIQDKNPNLNFDVAQMPANATSSPEVYGTMNIISIVKKTSNYSGALGVISILTSPEAIGYWDSLTNLPPVRRDLLSQPVTDPYQTVFNKAAVQSETWLDPDPVQSDQVFEDMIESVTSGKKKVEDAITDAKQLLDNLLQAQS